MILLRRLALPLALACALARPAAATSTDCAHAPDGTPCQVQCFDDGACRAGQCAGMIRSADGTPCATGLLCTTGDHCVTGACTPGRTITCALSACGGPARCVEGVGCIAEPSCDMASFPDMQGDGSSGDRVLLDDLGPGDVADAVSAEDLVAAPTDDLAAPTDDLALAPTDDLAAADGGVDDADSDDAGAGDASIPDEDMAGGDDGGVPEDLAIANDATVTEDGGEASAWLHVHGSGCAISGHGEPASALLLLALLLLARRSRR